MQFTDIIPELCLGQVLFSYIIITFTLLPKQLEQNGTFRIISIIITVKCKFSKAEIQYQWRSIMWLYTDIYIVFESCLLFGTGVSNSECQSCKLNLQIWLPVNRIEDGDIPSYISNNCIFCFRDIVLHFTSWGPLRFGNVKQLRKVFTQFNASTEDKLCWKLWRSIIWQNREVIKYYPQIFRIQFAGSTHHRCLRCPRVWHRPLFLHCVRGTVDQDQQNLPDLQRLETECQKAKLHLAQVPARHHLLYSGRSGCHQCHMVLGLTTRGHSPPPDQRGQLVSL